MVGTLVVLATPTSANAAPISVTPTPTIVAVTPEISAQISQVRVAATRLRSFARDDTSEIMIGRNPPTAPQSAGAIPGVWPKGAAIPFTMRYRGDTRVATITVSPPAASAPVTFTDTISGGPSSTLAGPGAVVNVVRFDLAVQAAAATSRATIATIRLSDLVVNGSTFPGAITLESTSASGAAPRLFSSNLLVGFEPSSSVDISGTLLLTGSFVASQEASRVEIVLGSDAPPQVALSSPPAEIELDMDYPITATISDTLLDTTPTLSYTVPSGCSLSDALSSSDTAAGVTTYSETRQLRCSTPGPRSLSVAGADPYSPAQTATSEEFVVLPEPPTISSMQLAQSPAAVNTPVTLTAVTNESTTECVIDWGDGTSDTVTPDSGVCTASRSYSSVDEYTVSLVARDSRDRESKALSATISVVADPPPTVSAGDPAGYRGDINKPIVVSGTATDSPVDGIVVDGARASVVAVGGFSPAAGIATTTWSAERADGSPAPCTFADPTSLTTTVVCTGAGTFSLVLTVVDSASQVTVVRVPLEIGLGDLPTLPDPGFAGDPSLARTGAADTAVIALSSALVTLLGALLLGLTACVRRAAVARRP